MEVEGLKATALKRVRGHGAEITGIFAIPQDKASGRAGIVSVDRSGLVLLWTVSSGEAFQLMQLDLTPTLAAFCSDKNLLAVAGQNKVRIVDLRKREAIGDSKSLDTNATAIKFSPDCRKVLLGAVDGRVYQWKFAQELSSAGLDNREKQKLFEAYIGHSTVISALAYHPRGRVFFSADWKGSISAWLNYEEDPFMGQWDRNMFGAGFFAQAPDRRITGDPAGEGIDFLDISPDGEWLAVARRGGELEMWQVRGFRRVLSFRAHKGVVQALAFAPDGQRVATSGRDAKLKIMKISPTGASGLGGDRYRIDTLREVEIAGIVGIDWLDPELIIAGDGQGKVMEIKVEENRQ